MENKIHTQKVTILSRLIKESSLTFEEALLLLKEEEEDVDQELVNNYQEEDYIPQTSTGTWITTNVPHGTYPPTFISGFGSTTTTLPLGSNISFTNTNGDKASPDLNT